MSCLKTSTRTRKTKNKTKSKDPTQSVNSLKENRNNRTENYTAKIRKIKGIQNSSDEEN